MRTILESNMLYSDEHTRCSNYIHDVKHGFKYREYPYGSTITTESLYANIIIFMMKGSVRYDCCTERDKRIGAGQMLFLPIRSLCDLEFEEDSAIIELAFEKWDFSCQTVPFRALRKLSTYIDGPTNVLQINDALQSYLNLLLIYLRNGVSCGEFHRIKTDEFFILLRHFYSKEQVAGFLAPLLGASQEFRLNCLKMRSTSHNITELVNQSGMSKTKFYEEFRKEFGDINPKKWFDRFLEYKILHQASKPGVTVKELAFDLDFESESAFSQYCHRHFGLTASELIKNRRKSLENL